jgi:hypothetical protein
MDSILLELSTATMAALLAALILAAPETAPGTVRDDEGQRP